MVHMLTRICLPVILFGIFVIAGSIGLYCESMHNDLTLSTTAFLTSFGTLSATVVRIWYSFT